MQSGRAIKSRSFTLVCFLLLLAWISPLGVAAEVKFVTEYRYPTAFDVTPVVRMGPNGAAQIVGGIVTPTDFETREVGVALSVYAVVGRIAGADGVADAAGLINGNTGLMVASTSGDHRSVVKAIDAGAKVNDRNRFGSTALLGAAAGGHDKIVRILLQNKAEVNLASADGSTPLMFAARNGHTDVVTLLIAQGANVNDADSSGMTALAHAVRAGHATVARQLLAAGADPNRQDRNGTTPLMLAQAHDSRDLVILLTRPGRVE